MLFNPGSKLSKRDLPLALLDQKVACFKILKTGSEERSPIVFNGIAYGCAGRNPDRRLGALGLDADQNICFAHILAEPDVPMFCITNQQFASVQSLNRGLIIQLKLSDGGDNFAEKLNSDRQRMMPGEDIQNTATHSELATGRHLGRFFIAALQ